MKRRVLSMLLVLCFVVALLPTTVLAADGYNDIAGHWGEAAINQWSENGIFVGTGNGGFNPEGKMTRAELATVIAKLLNLPEPDENAENFADVPAGAWYAKAMLQCRIAGIMVGGGNNMGYPLRAVTREETFVLIGRALGVKPVESESQFADGASVADWAAPYVNAMAEKGFVQGTGDNKVAPKAEVNRASAAALLDQTISDYVNTPNAEVEVDAAEDNRITMIAAPGVTVKGEVKDLVVATGSQGGDVTVESTNVTGGLTVVSPNTTVTLKVDTTVASADLAETAVQSKIVVEETAKVENLTASAPESKVEVSGTVENVTVADTASNTTVTASEGSTITKVDNAAEGTTVSGTGTVENVTTSGNNTTIDTEGTKVEVAEGTEGTTANGEEVSGGETVITTTHTWVDEEVVEPTCTEAGKKIQVCTDEGCEATREVVIPALGHDFKDGFCTRCGEMVMTEGDTIDKAINYMVGYILTHEDVAVKDYVLSVSEVSEKSRCIVVDIADNKGEEDYQALKNALKDGWVLGDYSNLKYDIDNGVAGLSAISSVTVYNSDRTPVTIEDVPALLKKMDKAKNVEDLKTILREDVKPTTDKLHVDGINSSTKLGQLVEVTAKDAIRICVTDKEGTPYYYTIVCK